MANGNRVTLDDMRRILNMDAEPEVKVDDVEAIAEASVDDSGKVKIYKSTLKALSKDVVDFATDNLKPHFTEVITTLAEDQNARTDEAFRNKVADFQSEFDKKAAEILALAETVRPIEIKGLDGKHKKIKGVQHKQFENLLKITGAGLPALLVGPAGTGKTHAAETIAGALNLKFYSISVGSQTSKSDIQGYMTGNGSYVRTQFREAYENGGLFLLDEADAGNSNVLILLNAALSNGYMPFPDGMIQRHPNFRMIAAANTYGNGASRQYVGRNQLDAATLDRFTVLAWDIDDKVEASLAGTSAEGKRWLSVVRAVRKRALDELELRVVISPRATLRGATLLAAGLDFESVMVSALTGNIPSNERPALENLARTTWDKA